MLTIFMRFVKLCFWDKYASFAGRANRNEYWGFHVLLSAVSVILFFAPDWSGLDAPWFKIFFIFGLLTIPPLIGVTVRRLHDIGLSGWFYWLNLLPPLGQLALLILTLWQGNQGLNRFDTAPETTRKFRPVYLLKRTWILTSLFVVILLTQLPWRSAPITVQTHYITQPMTESGTVDYYAALVAPYANAYARPDDNGYRLILEAVGPQAYFNNLKYKSIEKPIPWNVVWNEVCRKLNVDTVPENGSWPFGNWEPLGQKYFDDNLTRTQRVRDEELDLEYEKSTIDYSSLNVERQLYERSNYEPGPISLSAPLPWDELQKSPRLLVEFYLERQLFQPWSSGEHKLAAQYLQQCGPLLDTLSVAVRKPYYVSWYKRPNDCLLSLHQENCQFDLQLAKTIQLRINQSIGDDRPDDAISDIATLYRLAYHVRTGPGIRSMLVGTTVEGYGGESIRQLLLSGKATDSQLAALDEELSTLPRRTPVQNSMHGEYVTVFDSLQAFYQNRMSVFKVSPRNATRFRISDVVDETAFRKQFSKIFLPYCDAVADPDPVERLEKIRNADDLLGIERANQSWAPYLIRDASTCSGRSRFLGTSMTRLLLPVTHNCLIADLRTEEYFRLNRIVIALERFRLAHNQYPKALEELAESGLLTDPERFLTDIATGKPSLIYRVNNQSPEDWLADWTQKHAKKPDYYDNQYKDKSIVYYRPFILYSIGPNSTDDGGIALYRDGDWIW